MKKYERIATFLVKFLHEEVTKTGLERVVLGLSGGVDSAVVALLAKRAFDSDMLCVMMPDQHSNPQSVRDATELCDTFDLPYEIHSIAPLTEAYTTSHPLSALRHGNFAARMRMAVLYDISAKERALVLGTSNKSELLLGYGTLHGDLASALNPIGDLYKTEVFELAEYLGVTEAIRTKSPSADLWEGQSDEAELGYTYAQIDAFYRAYVDERIPKAALLEQGFDPALVDMALQRLYKNQFKRRMPIIAKLGNRTIGHDFLYPRDIKL